MTLESDQILDVIGLIITISNAINMFLLGLIINYHDIWTYIKSSFSLKKINPENSCSQLKSKYKPQINPSIFAALPALYFLMPLIMNGYTELVSGSITDELKLGILLMATTSTGSLATVFSSYLGGHIPLNVVVTAVGIVQCVQKCWSGSHIW